MFQQLRDLVDQLNAELDKQEKIASKLVDDSTQLVRELEDAESTITSLQSSLDSFISKLEE